MSPALIVTIVVVVVILVIELYFRKKQPDKLMNLLLNQKYEEFDKEAGSFLSRFFVNPFNLTCLILNRFIMEDNCEKVTELLNGLKWKNIKGKQKEYLANTAFNYYVAGENKEESKKYLDMINESGSEASKKQAERAYDTMIEHGWKYLDEVLTETQQLPDEQKVPNYALLSLMYSNKGDDETARKYSDLTMKIIEESAAKAN